MISVCFQGKAFNITVIQVYVPTTKLKLNNSMKASSTNFKKRCPFHQRGLDAKAGSQETPKVTGKFCRGVQNAEGQRLTEFCQENTLDIANTLFQQQETTLHMDIMVNIEIRLITLFAVEDGEALYNLQKQDQELTVTQVMRFLLQIQA